MSHGLSIAHLAGGVNPAALGRRVFREGAFADLDAVETVNLFRVSGGEVMITMMYGKLTALITGALTTHPIHTPTSNATATDMSAISLTLEAGVVDDILSWDGLITDALEITGTGIGVPFSANTQILVPGVIGLTTAVVATVGAIDWTVHYVPLDPNAFVNAL